MVSIIGNCYLAILGGSKHNFQKETTNNICLDATQL